MPPKLNLSIFSGNIPIFLLSFLTSELGFAFLISIGFLKKVIQFIKQIFFLKFPY